MYTFPPYHYSVIIGLLLSDGWLTYSNKGSVNPRLGFKQSLEKLPYLYHVFSVLSPFCGSTPRLSITKRKENTTYGLEFFTRALPCIKSLHEIFYSNNVKIVPSDIYNLLDPIALAHWICGDGSVRVTGLVLCTDSYSIYDVVRLVNVLFIRYELKCTIRSHKKDPVFGYRIYIKQSSMIKLRSIVQFHIIPSMLYKIIKVS